MIFAVQFSMIPFIVTNLLQFYHNLVDKSLKFLYDIQTNLVKNETYVSLAYMFVNLLQYLTFLII